MRTFLAAIFILALTASTASAAIEVPTRAIWSITDVDNLQFCDKCDPSVISQANRVENYRRTIADTVAMGARAILVSAKTGSPQQVRLSDFVSAVTAWNDAAPAADDVCYALLYADYGTSHPNEFIEGQWSVAWAGGGANYCTIAGQPVIATLDDRADWGCNINKQTNIFNRLKAMPSPATLASAHWVAAFGEVSEYTSWNDNCRGKVGTSGLPITYSYLEMANDDPSFMTDMTTRKSAVTQNGGRYILGIPSGSGRNCGDFCGDNDATGYRHVDFDGFSRALAAWRSGADNVAYTYGPGGIVARDEFVSSSTRCDPNDMATPSSECSAPVADKLALIPGAPGSGTTTTPPPVAGTGQCANDQIPAPASAAGLTKLAFCDDFSDMSKSFDLTAARWNPNVKWSREIPFTDDDASASGFTISDGILTLSPNTNTYQWTFTSAHNDGGTLKGYWMTGREWYAEIRWRFGADWSATSGYPGFWSMDTCHVYGIPNCASRTWLGGSNPKGEYIEPDFIEKWGSGGGSYLLAYHIHTETSGMNVGVCQSQSSWPGPVLDWHTAGYHQNPSQSDGVIRYYYNNVMQKELNSSASGWNCYSQADGRASNYAATTLTEMKNGAFPINVGTGPSGSPLYIDWVRVWVRP